MGGIFVSYRREDSTLQAFRLSDRLKSVLGKDKVFIDEDLGTQPGALFAERIMERIATSDTLIVVIGPDWLTCPDTRSARSDCLRGHTASRPPM